MEDETRVTFDMTAVLIAWPTPTAIVIIATLLIFRRQLSTLIERLRKFSRGSWSAEADAPVARDQKPSAPPAISEALAQASDKKADPRAAADAIVGRIVRNEFVNQIEDEIQADLAKRGLPTADPETHRVLLTALASVAVSAMFERLYNTIWTSQIEILQAVNERPLSDEEARRYYDQATKLNSAFYRDYPFEQYMKFLLDEKLLLREENGSYRILIKGRTFLLFMVNTGKPKYRAAVY